jgi:hypothetical protein
MSAELYKLEPFLYREGVGGRVLGEAVCPRVHALFFELCA